MILTACTYFESCRVHSSSSQLSNIDIGRFYNSSVDEDGFMRRSALHPNHTLALCMWLGIHANLLIHTERFALNARFHRVIPGFCVQARSSAVREKNGIQKSKRQGAPLNSKTYLSHFEILATTCFILLPIEVTQEYQGIFDFIAFLISLRCFSRDQSESAQRLQGGQTFENEEGSGGESIYGPTFEDEAGWTWVDLGGGSDVSF